MVRYPILSVLKANEILAERRGGGELDEDSFVEYRGEGEVLDLAFLYPLVAELEKVRHRFPDYIEARSPDGGRFEAEACEIVHKSMRHLPPEVLCDLDFWRYLAVVRFPSLVEWRHGSPEAAAHPNNYGIGNVRRNLLYRMYIRADIGYVADANDPYELARVGDKDVWESHLIGVETGNVRSLARALLRYNYPDGGDGPVLKVLELRFLAKRLNRLRANVYVQLYDDHQAFELVAREAERAKSEVAKREVEKQRSKAVGARERAREHSMTSADA